MQLLLVRHGQTGANIDRILDTGAPGAPLTDLGTDQAAQRAHELAGQPVVAVYCSTLLRAQQTAGPIAAAHELLPEVRDGVREVLAGGLEGRRDDEARLSYRDTAFAWAGGDVAVTMPGASASGADFLAAYDAVIDEATARPADERPDGLVVVVSHGTASRVWTAASADNVTARWAREHPLPNTGTIRLERPDGGPWHVVDWDGHTGPFV